VNYQNILAASSILFILVISIAQVSFAQVSAVSPARIPLHTPTASLQYGPVSTQGGILWLRNVEVLDNMNNSIASVYDSNTVINNYTRAIPLSPGYPVQPVFDSYFVFNRLLPQFIPKISNVSLVFSYILNPFNIRYTTQALISNSTAIPVIGSFDRGQFTSFLIPKSMQNGYYLAKLYVYFPQYNVRATYSNIVSLYPSSNLTGAYNSSATPK